MQSQKLEKDIRELVENFSDKDFIYDFLIAFGFTKMTIKRLREGNSNLAQKDNQLIVKQKLFYEYTSNDDLYSLIEDLKNDSTTYTHKPRFIIVNNAKELLAIDTKTQETLAVELKELHKNIDFFMPWTGKEKYIAHQENPADVKAAEKMAHIYDEIVKLNPELTKKDNSHSLNVFLTRLLFCFFAEDTGIFEDNIFTKTIVNHTNDDGSDLAEVMSLLFEALDKKASAKTTYPSFIQEFPYVNGSLFTRKLDIPKLNSKVRKLIIDCGNQDWKEINPDIFGSMFQAVSVAEVRSGLGQHYTSVPNIMKVIEPLFLNDLREEYEKADTEKKLKNLLGRIYNLKIFDPACGSGNFLIIAYKQLRLLEMDIIKKIVEVSGQRTLMLSQVQLNQFYGIEIDDFACEIATLSLWLAEHQMNRKFKELFGDCKPSLPLSKSGNIVCGNATRLDWEQVCPKGIRSITKNEMEQMTLIDLQKSKQLEIQGTDNEIYILGNPPYLGAKLQNMEQKEDLTRLLPDNKNLDYISCWFYKAAEYLNNTEFVKCAFVSTNSICQGEQVYNLWSKLNKFDIQIYFAHTSFKWTNNAKYNAGVTCCIIGLCSIKEHHLKYIYTNVSKNVAKNINAYLLDANDIYISRQHLPISKLPTIVFGSMPRDGGFLSLTASEKENLLNQFPQSQRIIKKYIGSAEFIRNLPRFCLWIEDSELDLAKSIPFIQDRLNKIYDFRSNSEAPSTKAYANRSHMFVQRAYKPTDSIIVPKVSSERRKYIPIGFVDKDTVISDLAFAIYDAKPWVFGVVTSRMHMVWVKAVAGRLKTDYRYSAELCYNTFPFPEITDRQKQTIEMHVNNILAEREKHSDKTMAELYDPDKMPQSLREAHHSLDLAIEKCYKQTPFESDEKRLEHLFKRYEIMTDPTKQNNPEEQLSLL